MKPAPNNPIMASRHSLGAVPHANHEPATLAALLMRALDAFHRAIAGSAVAMDFVAREASPVSLPSHGFQPEADTLCSAHWNRIYLIGRAHM